VTEDEQDSAARLADRGDSWVLADRMQSSKTSDALRQALRDRDRFQRERGYWREQYALMREQYEPEAENAIYESRDGFL